MQFHGAYNNGMQEWLIVRMKFRQLKEFSRIGRAQPTRPFYRASFIFLPPASAKRLRSKNASAPPG